jgi:hypothetical protein
MFILDWKDLREAAWAAALGGAVAIGLALYFRSNIEIYLGETITKWLFVIAGVLYLLSVLNVIQGWLFVREGERLKREREAADKREREEWERQDREQKVEWDAFTNWVKQNPATAERLMCIVEHEQIKDPEHRAWLAESEKAKARTY